MLRRQDVPAERWLDRCHTQPQDLEECLDRLKEFIWPYAGCMDRSEQRDHCEDFVRGLLSDLGRKSTEPIAERAGKHRRLLQRFIGESTWDHVPLLNKLCWHVADQIGSPDAVLAIDPTTMIKKGKASVGVARQWCGRLGHVENCQLGVFMGYISEKGRTLVDARLFLPEEWASDPQRRASCHIPKAVKYKPTSELALEMLRERRLELPHAWVTLDAEFGRSQKFRASLRQMGERYIVATEPRHRVREAEFPANANRRRTAPMTSARRLIEALPDREWTRVKIRDGAKGPIVVWAARARVQASLRQKIDPAVEWLLVIRTDGEAPDYRYYLSNAGTDVSVEALVEAAAARWQIEDCFERAKGRVGLHHCEARSWEGWHHHVTLAMLAMWFLVLEQRRIGSRTPAITLQQSAEAIPTREDRLPGEKLAHLHVGAVAVRAVSGHELVIMGPLVQDHGGEKGGGNEGLGRDRDLAVGEGDAKKTCDIVA